MHHPRGLGGFGMLGVPALVAAPIMSALDPGLVPLRGSLARYFDEGGITRVSANR